MIQVASASAVKGYLQGIARHHRIGLVPTMGALHEGHLALIRQARAVNEQVLVSIFVNPAQFNRQQDYQTYPVTLEEDCRCLEKLGVDCLFLPQECEMYPHGYDFALTPRVELADRFEGSARPGHFAGMLTIVLKLLLLVRPDRAYFGEKDYQQVHLIQQMARSFFLPTEIVRCATVREASGIPLSSRNRKLTPEQKRLAEQVYSLLTPERLSDLDTLAGRISRTGVELEYLALWRERVFMAMHIGGIRLIDNFLQETGPCSFPC